MVFLSLLRANQKVHVYKPLAYDVLTKSGRLVHVILVAVVCDKPAAHKIGGFVSHSHTNFCNICWITQHDKSNPAAFWDGGVLFIPTISFTISHLTGFHCRMDEEHC